MIDNTSPEPLTLKVRSVGRSEVEVGDTSRGILASSAQVGAGMPTTPPDTRAIDRVGLGASINRQPPTA